MLSQKLTHTFCMEDMDTLDMPDTMDIPMEDMPTLDKIFPLKMDSQPSLFSLSVTTFSVLDIILGDRL